MADNTSTPLVGAAGTSTHDRQKEYDEASERWRTTLEYRNTKKFFEESILPLKNLKVDQAICIGLGSFEMPIKNPRAPEGPTCLTQFIAFEYWLELLRTIALGDINFSKGIYFQEPDFTENDKLFIKSKGYSIIDTPLGRNDKTAMKMMTAETFAFIPCGGTRSLIYDSLEVAHPPLMITWPTHQPNHDLTELVPDPKGKELHEKGTIHKPGGGYGKIRSPELRYGRLERIPLERFRRDPKPGHSLRDLPEDKKTDYMRRRQIARPYQSTHLFRPLFVFSNTQARDEFVPGRADLLMRQIKPEWSWQTFVWIYWKPDNKERLTKYEVDDELECPCDACWQDKPFLSSGSRFDRAPSPIRSPSSSSGDGEGAGQGKRKRKQEEPIDPGYGSQGEDPANSLEKQYCLGG